eukprot:TRINITY_DN10073_c0_g1_i1.p1 TRINITY_DN10073_c0_g1~~TRINITY_DN10073_c0_g1_i1.p1  ORF type:complete len:331 (+),score=132.16 TRINITY_DN10073_c0_g1_i1:175-1167(+)
MDPPVGADQKALIVTIQVGSGRQAVGMVVHPHGEDWETVRLPALRSLVCEQVSDLSRLNFLFANEHGVPVSRKQESFMHVSSVIAHGKQGAEVRIRRAPARVWGDELWTAMKVLIVAVVGAIFWFPEAAQHMPKVAINGTVIDPGTSTAYVNTNPFFALLADVGQMIVRCVFGYYSLFERCWMESGKWLVDLVNGFYHMLELLFDRLFSWPSIVVTSVAAWVTLYWIWRILQLILQWRLDTQQAQQAWFDKLKGAMADNEMPEQAKQVVGDAVKRTADNVLRDAQRAGKQAIESEVQTMASELRNLSSTVGDTLNQTLRQAAAAAQPSSS